MAHIEEELKGAQVVLDYKDIDYKELEEIEELMKPFETYWKQQKQEGRKQNA